MIKYVCDICGLTFNDHGHFENGKPCNLYGSTYDGCIICHRCFEKMFINRGNDV